LVSVYSSSLNNGGLCKATRHEVWRSLTGLAGYALRSDLAAYEAATNNINSLAAAGEANSSAIVGHYLNLF
jgi:hypothetical protein